MQAPPAWEGASPPRRASKSWVWLAVGGCGVCACLPILAAVLFPVFAQARRSAIQTAGLAHLKMANLAILQYSAENDDYLPAATKWQDQVVPFVTDPSAWHKTRRSLNETDWAYSTLVAGKKETSFKNAQDYMTLFESTLGNRNAHGDFGAIRGYSSPRDPILFAFLDGHVKAIRAGDMHAYIEKQKTK